eukprot:CAMPEP_0117555444 /NCGR_PEP_ID=MMETSP0784-20121206/51278_1 /TAXON_ID=39447 /ORGANISM="" /LENGTH=458 /DNA_ID=CAMNT_0005352651 /DNA_START=46 /DNA_END=1422 /DNA_ORIENTATION=+
MTYAFLCSTLSTLVALRGASAVGLPRFRVGSPEAAETAAKLNAAEKWWTQLGDHVYHEPDEGSPLSANIEDYYYAVGSLDALDPEVTSRRVGGGGRLHLFELPAEVAPAALLQIGQNLGDRRSSISRFHQLQTGTTLSSVFPKYMLSDGYENPLSSAGQQVEHAAVEQVTVDSFKLYLDKVTGLWTRSATNASASALIVEMAQKEFIRLEYTTCLQTFSTSQGRLRNVIAFAPGAEQGAVVVGAHYDSRPFTGAAPGAEDNGSGLAALLAMARAFKEAKVVNKKPVYFVAFAGEESGLLGSARFAPEILKGGGSIPTECGPRAQSFLQLQGRRREDMAALIMDEVGWVSKDPAYPKRTVNLESMDSSRAVMDHMAASCKDHNGADALDIIHNSNPFGSDHMSFLNNGISAVLSINADDEAYPNYHKSTDTIENVTPEYATQIAKMNMGALLRLSGVEA